VHERDGSLTKQSGSGEADRGDSRSALSWDVLDNTNLRASLMHDYSHASGSLWWVSAR